MTKTLIVLALAAGILALPATAARQPTNAEKKAITATVKGFYEYWWYYKPSGVAGLEVKDIRISTVDAHWAAAAVTGPKTASKPALIDRVLLYHGVKRWIVADAPSTEFIGCGVAPAAVNRDLFRGLGGC
jgi:hypothetical protein